MNPALPVRQRGTSEEDANGVRQREKRSSLCFCFCYRLISVNFVDVNTRYHLQREREQFVHETFFLNHRLLNLE